MCPPQLWASPTGLDQSSSQATATLGGDLDTRRSASGIVFTIAGAAVHYSSRLKSVVALSVVEAEYIAASKAGQDATWISRLVAALGSPIGTVTIYSDSQSGMKLTKHHIISDLSKHIDIKYHHIRDLVSNKVVQFEYMSTERNTADTLTKHLGATKHLRAAALRWASTSQPLLSHHTLHISCTFHLCSLCMHHSLRGTVAIIPTHSGGSNLHCMRLLLLALCHQPQLPCHCCPPSVPIYTFALPPSALPYGGGASTFDFTLCP